MVNRYSILSYAYIQYFHGHSWNLYHEKDKKKPGLGELLLYLIVLGIIN
jgi:hypothetical protein